MLKSNLTVYTILILLADVRILCQRSVHHLRITPFQDKVSNVMQLLYPLQVLMLRKFWLMIIPVNCEQTAL